MGTLVVLATIISFVIWVYLVMLAARLVSAMERISQNVDIGVAAWLKNLRQQSGGSAQPLPPTQDRGPTA